MKHICIFYIIIFRKSDFAHESLPKYCCLRSIFPLVTSGHTFPSKFQVHFVKNTRDLLLVGGTTVFAKTGTEKISARFSNIKLIVNDQVIKTKAEPFIYNGNVYAPVATVANKAACTIADQRMKSFPKVMSI